MTEHALSLEPDNAVDAAIARVLEAERAANDDIAAAHREAATIAESARAAVRDIEGRTERRIRKLRDLFANATERRLSELARAAGDATQASPLSPEDERRVEEAAARLAATLTGADP